MYDGSRMSVTQLNNYIKQLLDSDSTLRYVSVIGEIRSFKRAYSGHIYFTLSDKKEKLSSYPSSQEEPPSISSVMWRSNAKKLDFDITTGMKVLITGKISTYVKTNSCQLYVDTMEIIGDGQIEAEIKKLHSKLEREGLFNPRHKMPIPKFPGKIAVITSKAGAVISDIIRTVRERYPIAEIDLYPAAVQGDTTASEVINQIHIIEKRNDIDTLIIARGGGDAKLLAPFSNEDLVRTVYDCSIPTISSIGHQPDFCILDAVADKTVATPTAAAVAATPDQNELKASLKEVFNSIDNNLNQKIRSLQNDLNNFYKASIFQVPEYIYDRKLENLNNIFANIKNSIDSILKNKSYTLQSNGNALKTLSPKLKIDRNEESLTSNYRMLKQNMSIFLNNMQQKLQSENQHLTSLDPTNVMKRGFTYISKDGHVITNVNQIKSGDNILLNFSSGKAHAEIKDIE